MNLSNHWIPRLKRVRHCSFQFVLSPIFISILIMMFRSSCKASSSPILFLRRHYITLYVPPPTNSLYKLTISVGRKSGDLLSWNTYIRIGAISTWLRSITIILLPLTRIQCVRIPIGEIKTVTFASRDATTWHASHWMPVLGLLQLHEAALQPFGSSPKRREAASEFATMPAEGYERLQRDGEARNVASAYPGSGSWRMSLAAILAVVCVLVALIVRAFVSPSVKSSVPGSHLVVCYSGRVSSLLQVYEQNLRNLKQFDPKVTVSFLLDLEDEYELPNGTRSVKMRTKAELRPVFKAMDAVDPQFYSERNVEVPKQSECFDRASTKGSQYVHDYVAFLMMAKCYDQIKVIEESRGSKFDWVLRLQPNMYIKIDKPPTKIPPRIHMSGFAAALVPRSMADVYFGAVAAFEDSNCKQLDTMGYEPCQNYSYDEGSTECLVIKWLKRHGIVPSNGVYVNRKVVQPT